MSSTIRRNLALREYDVKTLPSGRQAVFSVKFVKKNGELSFIPRGVASGLPFHCLLYTSPSPRDRTRTRMPSSA